MAEEKYTYEKYSEEGTVTYCPGNDYDGSVTGHIVMNVRAWFDENPEERKRLGWIKHIHHDVKEIDFNRQTHYIIPSVKQVDPYTIEDVYHVAKKSEELLALEEMLDALNYPTGGYITFLNGGT